MTNAFIQRWFVYFTLICCAAGFWLLGSGRLALALALIFVPLLFTPVILAIDCAWAAGVNRFDSAPRASAAQWVRAWWAESVLAVKVFGFWQPFRRDAIPDFLPVKSSQRGVVLVHGYFCNRALWTPHMEKFQAQGIPFVAVDLEPAFESISLYPAIVEEAVKKLEQSTGLPPLIIGHSMGGLAIRAWAAADAKALDRVHRIITLGTPHSGTVIAQCSFTPNGVEMRRGSAWLANNLKQLQTSDGNKFAQKLICFYSNCDNIVFPATTATYEGADNRHEAGRAHVELAYSEGVWRAIDDVLKSVL